MTWPLCLIENTLNALLEGYQGDMPEARAFLRRLFEISPDETVCSVIPVARRLIEYPNWQRHAPEVVRDYMVARHEAIESLAQFETADFDARAEFMIGCLVHFEEVRLLKVEEPT